MLKINLKTIAGLFVAVIFALGVTSVAQGAWMTTTTTKVTKTSSSADVMWLQETLNAVQDSGLTVDGSYGPRTTAAIKKFQRAHPSAGVADGIAGRMTIAALNAAGATMTTTTTTTTTTGTQALCPNGMTLASNCMSAPSAMATSPLCPNGMTLASNCMSASGTSTSTTTTTTLQGGAGNISSVITLGSPSSVTVSEGDSAKSVLGFEIKADSGSDLSVSNIGIKLSKTAGNGSTWISRYVNKVSIMQGSTVIGSISASALTQNGNDYVATIPVSGAKIAANQRASFYVAIDANTNIDSNDSGSTITATITSIRYSDATNVVLSMVTTNNQSFTVQKLSSNANVKLQVSEDATNPRNRTITSNYTSTTTDVSLLKFNVTANGSAMNLNEIDLVATTNNTVLDEVTKAAKLFKLKYTMNGVANTATVNFASGLSGSTARVLKFGDTSTTNSTIYTANSLNGGGSLMIPVGQTMSFEVLADVLPIASSGTTAAAFEAGDILKVNLPSAALRNGSIVGASVTASTSDAILTTGADGSATCSSVTAVCWQVLDQNGNSINTSSVNRQGSASGYDATFRVQGLSATLAASPAVTNTYNNSGVLTTSTVPMDVSVTASGSDFFIPRSVGIATSASDTTIGANGFLIAPLNNAYAYSTPTTSTGISATVSIVSGATTDGSGRFKVNAGQTAVFRITATVTNGSTPVAGSRYVQLNAVGGAIDTTTAPTSFATTPAASFQSAGTAAF